MNFSKFKELVANHLSVWPIVVLIFAGLFLVLHFIWRKSYQRLKKWSEKTENKIDDEIVTWLNLPANISIAILSFYLAISFSPEVRGIIPYLNTMIKLATIFIFTWVLGKISVLTLKSRMAMSGLDDTTRNFFANIVRIFIFSIGLLIVLDTMGISITPIIASLGIGSIAVGLALQDTLSNFFSGVYIILDKPFRVNDFIKIDDNTEGFVIKIGWRSTHLRLLANHVVVVPNSKIAGAQIVNYDLPDKETAVLLQAGVSYNSDLEKVEKVTCEVAKEIMQKISGAIPTFDPFIRYHTFGESSINFTIILRALSWTDQYLLKHEFIKALHKRYQEIGIEIPFPQRVVHFPQEDLQGGE